MLKIILHDPRPIAPFNEPARDLRIQNKPLWLNQRDVLTPYTDREIEVPLGSPLPQVREACLVYRDNLYFDEFYIRAFLEEARRRKHPIRAAFTLEDPAFREHALPLSVTYTRQGDLYLADLWYYPNGPDPDAEPEPVVIDLQAREIGYYHVPTYMATEKGDLVFQVPLRALIAIDSWVHIFIADIV
ncbi:multidrug transporter, partial [Candidatus Parcubacteria bacterium]